MQGSVKPRSRFPMACSNKVTGFSKKQFVVLTYKFSFWLAFLTWSYKSVLHENKIIPTVCYFVMLY
jgi:hypothetical protein